MPRVRVTNSEVDAGRDLVRALGQSVNGFHSIAEHGRSIIDRLFLYRDAAEERLKRFV